MSNSNFLAQWDGYVTLPAGATNVKFGVIATSTATASVFLNGSSTATVTASNTSAVTPTYAASGITLPAGPNKIRVQFSDGATPAQSGLYVQYTNSSSVVVPADPVNAPAAVPAGWLTQTVQSLPDGWAASQPLIGDAANFVREQNTGGSIVFTDSDGATHAYTQTVGVAGGYTPPAGEQGQVTIAGDGTVNFTDEAGTVSVFSQAGQLVSATSPADPMKPAAPVPAYGTSGQIISLTDRLSSGTSLRQVKFVYSDTTTQTGACVQPTGTGGILEPAPLGYLCQLQYPDGTTTQLYYDTNNQLAEILDPGGEMTNFNYGQNSTGPRAGQYVLWSIRNSVANDWLAANSSRTSSTALLTVITSTSDGLAQYVTLPAPDGVSYALQPQKTYTYGAGVSYMDQGGIPFADEATGHTRTVTYNATLQDVTDVSASGLTTTNAFDSADNPWSTIDPRGLESTTIYDSLGRATDSYGPAPSTCFNVTTRLPAGACSVTPAHSKTVYDGVQAAGALKGLNVAYYNNAAVTGPPTAFALGVDTNGDGAVNQTWSGAPATGVSATNFSAVLTGTIAFPANGVYTINTAADDVEQVFINDVLTSNNTAAGQPGTGTFTATTAATGAPQLARIRIVYVQLTAAASISLSWSGPGVTTGVIPGTALSPAYNLVTSSTTDDSIGGTLSSQVPAETRSTEYGSSPWLGQVASTTVDPGGANLTSSAAYENVSTLYGRQLTSTKPAGAATTSTNTYYGPADTIGTLTGTTAAVCGLPSTTPEYGMVMTSTGPTPASGAAAQTSFVYDLLGRVVGSLRAGDAAWTCLTYDARGRVTSTAYPAHLGAPARTVTNNYAVGGDPLTTSVSDGNTITGAPNGDTITTVSDLLGRTVSSTDVWGTVTTNTYNDPRGTLLSSTTTPPGGTAQTESYLYNGDGRSRVCWRRRGRGLRRWSRFRPTPPGF